MTDARLMAVHARTVFWMKFQEFPSNPTPLLLAAVLLPFMFLLAAVAVLDPDLGADSAVPGIVFYLVLVAQVCVSEHQLVAARPGTPQATELPILPLSPARRQLASAGATIAMTVAVGLPVAAFLQQISIDRPPLVTALVGLAALVWAGAVAVRYALPNFNWGHGRQEPLWSLDLLSTSLAAGRTGYHPETRLRLDSRRAMVRASVFTVVAAALAWGLTALVDHTFQDAFATAIPTGLAIAVPIFGMLRPLGVGFLHPRSLPWPLLPLPRAATQRAVVRHVLTTAVLATAVTATAVALWLAGTIDPMASERVLESGLGLLGPVLPGAAALAGAPLMAGFGGRGRYLAAAVAGVALIGQVPASGAISLTTGISLETAYLTGGTVLGLTCIAATAVWARVAIGRPDAV